MSLAKQPVSTTNTTVHASAGSGKTYLLISRLICLLLEGVNPAAILAITFTRKAAAEMQVRLIQRLFALAASDEKTLDQELQLLNLQPSQPYRQAARGLYEKVLRAVQPIKITTFHAFCQELLRRFPLEADVPAGFELLDRAGALQDEAWEALVITTTKQSNSTLAQALDVLFEHLGLNNTKTALRDFLQHRSDWWAYTDQAPEPVSYACKRLVEQLNVDEETDPLVVFFNDTEVMQLLQRFAELHQLHQIDKHLNEATAIVDSLDNQIETQQRFVNLRNVFFTNKNKPRVRKLSKELCKNMGQEKAEEWLRLNELLCQHLATLADEIATLQTLQISCAWFQAGHDYLQHYQRIKLEQRLLDFTDLEWKTYCLLNKADNAPWVQYKLDTRIEHLLVDEFQDTNPTQWHLLLPLLQELASNENERQRSVFLVGDAKQSIYRFRRAEPRLFQVATGWLEKYLGANTLPMSKSWRSSPAIMDFVNTLFSTGPLNEQLPEFVKHETHLQTHWGQVTLLPLATTPTSEQPPAQYPLRNPLTQPRPENKDLRYLQEGQLIAAQIKQLINNKIVLGPEDKAHPICYGDIMILLRSRTHVRNFEQALREADIPYIGAERGALLDSLEVNDMMDLLHWLMTPHDNLALAGILRSPLFAASDTELMQITAIEKGAWFERLESLQSQLSAGSALHRAYAHLSRWQTLAGHIPAHDLLDRIYSEANVLARYVAAFPDHLKTRVTMNLSRFLELALEMDSGRYPSLMRFSAWLKELSQQSTDAPDEPPSLAQQDRVHIMTIHAAKGLEAPVVFLADAARDPKSKMAYQALIDWPAGQKTPASFLLNNKQQQQDPVSRRLVEKIQHEEKREEANLLYVATTRSQQLLYISGSRPNKGNNLGWYGKVAAQYQLKTENIDSPCLLEESNVMPTAVHPQGPGPVETIKLDPRLSKPLVLSSVYKEIAPSRAQHTASSGHVDTDPDGQQRGIAIHRLLEMLTQQQTPSLNEIAWSLDRPANDPDLQQWWDEAQHILNHPDLQTLFDPNNFQQAYNEAPIYYRQDNITVHGVIDRLVIADNMALIIDYKTHRHATADNLAEIAATYTEQMRLYTQAVQRLWPQMKTRTLILFTSCAKIFELDFT